MSTVIKCDRCLQIINSIDNVYEVHINPRWYVKGKSLVGYLPKEPFSDLYGKIDLCTRCGDDVIGILGIHTHSLLAEDMKNISKS